MGLLPFQQLTVVLYSVSAVSQLEVLSPTPSETCARRTGNRLSPRGAKSLPVGEMKSPVWKHSLPCGGNEPTDMETCSSGLENHFPCLEIHFPSLENCSPELEIHFPALEIHSPCMENRSPCLESSFPCLEIHSPHLEIHFPLLENHFPALEIRFPERQKDLSAVGEGVSAHGATAPGKHDTFAIVPADCINIPQAGNCKAANIIYTMVSPVYTGVSSS